MLVPGAGLARLCVEVAALGYEAQGNEFSYFMLLAWVRARGGGQGHGCRWQVWALGLVHGSGRS